METLDIAPLMVWIGALSLIVGFGTTIWNVFSSPARKNASDIEAMQDVAAAMDRRLQKVEDIMGVLPGRSDIHDLNMSISKLSGELGMLRTEMHGHINLMDRLERVVDRHEDHLRKGN